MRFASLGSGSAGNGLVIEADDTRLLLDCGFSLRDSIARLARLQLTPQQLTAILITHEHDDHASGAFKLANKFGIPVWLTHGTHAMLERQLPTRPSFECRLIDGHSAFAIGDVGVQPFPVPHDAREPVQFAFEHGGCRLGVLTDTGTPTPHIEQMLSGCAALVLECNHDRDMLLNGPYARSLKQRVGGRLGHLDNASAAALLARLDNRRLQHIIAAHLSSKNNLPELARAALSAVLNCAPEWIGVADQQTGFAWRSVTQAPL